MKQQYRLKLPEWKDEESIYFNIETKLDEFIFGQKWQNLEEHYGRRMCFSRSEWDPIEGRYNFTNWEM